MAKAAKKQPAAKKAKPAPAQDKIAAVGIEAVCERIAECEPLHKIASSIGVSKGVLIVWLDKHPDHYARAREAQADRFAEEILSIADEECTVLSIPVSEGDPVVEAVDSAAVQRNKLRVDARKWLASKYSSKRYGEKVVHAGDAENPLTLAMTSAASDLLAKIKG